jgi:hypothetical protein
MGFEIDDGGRGGAASAWRSPRLVVAVMRGDAAMFSA